jgi:hypothetical protein
MLFVFFVVVVLFPMPSFAEITKIVIDKREPFAAGHEFGVTGAYEKLVGKAYGEVDPKTHHNKNLVNLKNAPLNNRSRVEYSIDVLILKPIDMQRGNQTIFYDVVNRGNQALRVNFGAERSNNPTTLAHAGDGFMMRQGYTWCGAVGMATFFLSEVVSRQAFRWRKIRMAARSNARLPPSLFFRNQAFRCRSVSTGNRWM